MGNYGSRIVRGETGAFDQTGYAVSGIGDINGDGIDDFAVSARNGEATPDGTYGSGGRNGTVFVVYGSDDADLEFSLDDIDGTNGFKISADLTDYYNSTVFGSSVVGLGDVNDDGVDDFAIVQNATSNIYGEYYYYSNAQEGVAYIIYGGQSVTEAEVSVDDLDHFRADAAGEITDVSALGDVNGDGVNDIGIVANSRNEYDSRYVQIIQVYDYDGNGVYDADTDFQNYYGRYVGIDDVTGYVVYGTDENTTRTNNDPIAEAGGSSIILDLTNLSATEGMEFGLGQEQSGGGGFYGEFFALDGGSIDIDESYYESYAGLTAIDIDGDGINDIVTQSGYVYAEDIYAVYDQTGGGNDSYSGGIFSFGNNVSITEGTITGTGGETEITGVFPKDNNNVATLGNFAGNDAAQELAIGSFGTNGDLGPTVDPFTPGVYVINGTSNFFSSGTFQFGPAQVLAGDGSFFFSGNDRDDPGGEITEILGVIGVCDVNPPEGTGETGFDDLLIVARTFDDNFASGVSAYFVFGTEAERTGPIELEQLVANGGGYRITFDDDDLEAFGEFTVAKAGDVNGDGAADIIVGEQNEHTATVIHGGAALAAADAADGTIDGQILSSSLLVDVDTGLLPIELNITSELIIQEEGDTGVTDLVMEVTRTGDLTATVSFDFTVVSGGVASFFDDANAEDFEGGILPTGTVTFDVGSSVAQVTIPIAGDTDDEQDFEDFTVEISNGTTDNGALVLIGDDTGRAYIQNDDDPAIISVSATSVTEGDPGDDQVMIFNVQRTGDAESTVSVDWLVQPYIFSTFSAAESDDFEGGLNQSGVLTFAPGETSKTIELPILEDDVSGEGNERVTLTLSNATTDGIKGVEISNNNQTGTIFEDDFAPRFDVQNVFVTETDDTDVELTFTIVRSNDTTGTATIDFVLQNNTTSSDDFSSGFLDPLTGQPRSGTLTFAPGITTQTVTLQVAPDDEVESDEQVFIRLSNPTNDSGSGTPTFDSVGTGVILNDDFEVVFNIGNAFVTEGDIGDDREMVFTVTRSGLLDGEATVDFEVTELPGVTAADADDFVSAFPQTGTLTFADGVSQQTFSVVVQGDLEVEPTETFAVNLSNALPPPGEAARIANGSAVGIISNDDDPVRFSASSQTVIEGDTGTTTTMTFTVNRTGDTAPAATLDYSVQVFVGSQAADDADIVGTFPMTGTLSFASGVTSQTITVDIEGDGTVEQNEFFEIALSNADAGGAQTEILNPVIFGTIENDDLPTNHSVFSTSVTEGAGGALTPLTFIISRSGDTDVASSVDYNLLPNASNPTFSAESFDFLNGLPQSGTVNFDAGEINKQLTFQVVDDEVLENTESVVLQLSNALAPGNGAGATISNASATGSIFDDERPVIYSVFSASTTERDPGEISTLDFTVSRTGDTSVSGSVDYEIKTYAFSGADSSDLTVPLPIIGTVNFVAGQTSALVSVNVAGDNVFEGTEYLEFNLSNPQANDTGIDPLLGNTRSFGYIYDDDQPAYLRVSGSSITEGDSGSSGQLIFTIQRYGDSTSRVEVDYNIGGGTTDAADFASPWPTSGSVIFEANELVKQIVLNVQGDTDIESDEFTYMTLSNAQSLTSGADAVIAGATAGATIRNDDLPALISVQSSTSATEGDTAADNTFLTFTISRSGDVSSVVDVDYSFAGTGFDPIDIDDLQGGIPQNGTVRFAENQRTATVSFAILEDQDVEGNEQGRLTLSNAQVVSGDPDATVQITRSTSTGIISNDDQPPSIRVEVNNNTWGTSITEGDGGVQPVTFDIIRDGDTTGSLEVQYTIFSDGTSFRGASNVDFQGDPIGATNFVTFGSGQAVQSVTVLVQGDLIIEANEQFGFSVDRYESSADIDYTVLNPITSVTIRNDDGRPPIPELPFDVDGNGIIEPGEVIRVEADVFGDPHIVTLDGLGYDFQAVGEYILVETIEGVTNPFSVQVRFEPFPGSDLVSVTTRMAVEVKGKTVEVDAFADDPLSIDGVPVDLAQAAITGVDLDDDTTNSQDIFIDEDGKIFLTLNPAGEVLMIGVLDGSLNVCVFLGDPLNGGNAGQVRGLLGNANQDLSDDFGLRDGSDIPADVISFDDAGVPALDFDFVYGFGDFEGGGYRGSWSVDGGERLFSDAVPNFPDNFPAGPVDLSGVPQSLLDAAEAAADAAGITDPTLRQAAILDFVLTGDEQFVEGTANVAADPETSTDTTENPDAAPAVGVAANAVRTPEGDTGAQEVTFTFYRTGDTTGPLTVNYAIAADVDAADLAEGTPLSGTVSFADGEAERELVVIVKGDLTTERTEDLSVQITGTDNPAILVSGSQGTTQIVTDDFAPDAEDDLVVGDNTAPIAGNLFADNGQGEDTDPDGDTLTLVSVIIGDDVFGLADSPIELSDGSLLEFDETGSFLFTPGGDFAGLSSSEVGRFVFDYEVSDGNGGSDIGTATVSVEGSDAVNTSPEAVQDDFEVSEDDGLVALGNLLSNDIDAEGDATVTRIFDSAGTELTLGIENILLEGGLLQVNEDGELFYNPTGDFEALGFNPQPEPPAEILELSYEISDGEFLSTGTFTIGIRGENDAPEAAGPDSFVIDENTTEIAIIGATDAEDDDPTFSIADNSDDDDGGSFEIDATSGALRFVTAPDFELPTDGDGDNTYEVEVLISDGAPENGGQTTSKSITVTVEDVDEGGGPTEPNPIQGENNAGIEILVGTDDEDIIFSGGGTYDRITGGGSADVFVFEGGSGDGRQTMVITDYEVGIDSLDLGGQGVFFDFGFASATYLYLDGGDFDTIIVQGASGLGDITLVTGTGLDIV